MMHGQKNIKFD